MKRRHRLYCNVICSELVIVKMPEQAMAWRTIIRALNAAMRTLGVKAKDIIALEGLADPDSDDPSLKDAAFLLRLEQAFTGQLEPFAAFTLFAWDNQNAGFQLARKGRDKIQQTS
jgi:hypothetical protein